MVLGPALTAYLYKPGKPGLWLDMSFIAVVQIAALVYGGSVLYQQRPQYVVFSIDRFAVLPATDIVHDGGPIGACPAGGPRPCLAVAIPPDDAALRSQVLKRALEQGIELEQQPRLWRYRSGNPGRPVHCRRCRPTPNAASGACWAARTARPRRCAGCRS